MTLDICSVQSLIESIRYDAIRAAPTYIRLQGHPAYPCTLNLCDLSNCRSLSTTNNHSSEREPHYFLCTNLLASSLLLLENYAKLIVLYNFGASTGLPAFRINVTPTIIHIEGIYPLAKLFLKIPVSFAVE